MKIAFVTFYQENPSLTFSSKNISSSAVFIHNGFSYIYPHLKKDDFVIIDLDRIYSDDHKYIIQMKKKLEKYDRIFCTLFYSRIYFQIKNLIDNRWIFGGPGAEHLYFYSKNSISSSKLCLNCISNEILGFVSKDFSIYWGEDLPKKFDTIYFSFPTKYNSVCYKALRKGACSFCSNTYAYLKFRKKLYKYNKDLEYSVQSLFSRKENLFFFKTFEDKLKVIFISGFQLSYKDLFDVYQIFLNYKDFIKRYNILLRVYTTFDMLDIFLNNIKDYSLLQNIKFSISFESFDENDLKLMNKCLDLRTSFITLEKLLNLKSHLNTGLIINNNTNLDFNDFYQEKYIDNLRKFVSLCKKYSNSSISVALGYFLMSFNNRLANRNLLDAKIYERFEIFTRRIIKELLSADNISISILKQLQFRNKNYV